MKLLTFAIPSYNSEDYLERCVESLLLGKEEVEILIVNDGSTDKTGEIAKRYEEKYPTIVKAINKENGGHGSAVNKGLELSSGLYFKVVDSDDWFDDKAYMELLDTLHDYQKKGIYPDLFVCNYIYDHLDSGIRKTIKFNNIFKKDRVLNWDDAGRFLPSQNLLMHTLIYKTSILKDINLRLPEHTFYVDSIFAYVPLPHVKTLVYKDIDLYHYYIGRADQSINTKVMCSRIDQQIKVIKVVLDTDLNKAREVSKPLERYMCHYLAMMIVAACIHLCLLNDEASRNKIKELWDYIKTKDEKLYKRLKYRSSAIVAHPRTAIGRRIFIIIYELGKKLVKFQ